MPPNTKNASLEAVPYADAVRAVIKQAAACASGITHTRPPDFLSALPGALKEAGLQDYLPSMEQAKQFFKETPWASGAAIGSGVGGLAGAASGLVGGQGRGKRMLRRALQGMLAGGALGGGVGLISQQSKTDPKAEELKAQLAKAKAVEDDLGQAPSVGDVVSGALDVGGDWVEENLPKAPGRFPLTTLYAAGAPLHAALAYKRLSPDLRLQHAGKNFVKNRFSGQITNRPSPKAYGAAGLVPLTLDALNYGPRLLNWISGTEPAAKVLPGATVNAQKWLLQHAKPEAGK